MSVCLTQVSTSDVAFEDGEIKKGAFGVIEWGQDVDLMITRLDDGAVWSESNSAMFSPETFYFNREAKDGDIAGRVPVNAGTTTWNLLFLNYNSNDSQTIRVEYGAATNALIVTTLSIVASGLALLF